MKKPLKSLPNYHQYWKMKPQDIGQENKLELLVTGCHPSNAGSFQRLEFT